MLVVDAKLVVDARLVVEMVSLSSGKSSGSTFIVSSKAAGSRWTAGSSRAAIVDGGASR